MVSVSKLYEFSEKEWENFFILFRECDEEIFHKSIFEGSWSPENILRHLLGSLVIINNAALLTEKIETKLTFWFTENPEEKITIDQIEEEYHRLNEIVKKGMAEITPVKENELITFNKREMPRIDFLIMLFNHEHSHFGQLLWILKRETNWTTGDVFKKIDEKKK
ncbi:MAG: DinB family protein [Candidatus Thorarchaeota archaeon]